MLYASTGNGYDKRQMTPNVTEGTELLPLPALLMGP